MHPKRLTDRPFVAVQLQADDLAGARALGFKLIINNRSDGEDPDQPSAAQIATAHAAGLRSRGA